MRRNAVIMLDKVHRFLTMMNGVMGTNRGRHRATLEIIEIAACEGASLRRNGIIVEFILHKNTIKNFKNLFFCR